MFDKIKGSIDKFTNRGVADEEAVKELVKDIQRDLIAADVDVTLVSELSKEIKQEALEKDIPSGITRQEHVLETVYNKLEELLGEKPELEEKPRKILLCGLYGAGKTTTAGKLADFYRKKEMKVGLIAADTDRPAAYDQLKQISEQVNADFYGEPEAENPSKVVENGLKQLEVDLVIVDSAGRNSLDNELKEELQEIKQTLQPDQKYLVMPADIGQSAKDQTNHFHDAININGVIITKMDSSAKGGGALIACANSDANVHFIGTGEKMEDLELYDPVDFVSDMLGQPDLGSLLEKIEEMDADPEEMLEGDFTLEQFRQQIQQVSDTGLMEDMMQQLPFGKGKLPDNFQDITGEKLDNYNTIMDSMNDEEMNDPSIIKSSRVERIAKGSGTEKEQVNELLQHYRQTKNMMDKFGKGGMKRGNMKQMMSKLGL